MIKGRNIFKGVLPTMLLGASLVICGPTLGQAATDPKALVSSPVAVDPFLKQLVAMEDLEENLMNQAQQIQLFVENLSAFGLPPEAAWMTKHILVRAYSPKKFLQTIYDYVMQDYDQKNAVETIKWLRSPLGKQFKELVRKSWTQESLDERDIYIKMLKSFPPSETRLILSERLVKAWKLTDLTLKSIVPVFRLWFPHREKLLDQSSREVLKKLEKDLRKPIRENLIGGNLHVFMDLSDEEFANLVEFAESKPGTWFYTVFQQGFVVAFDEQVRRSKTHLDNFLATIGSGREGLEILKETFPPGERYIALRKRDPFLPLVNEEGQVQAASVRPRAKKVFKMLRGRLKNFPTIPLELYKKIKKDDPELYADLEYHQELFNDPESLQAMKEEEYEETVENYRELIDRANEARADFIKTPLQIDYKSLSFVGVIWRGKETLALVETPGKKGHAVRKGTIVGPSLGVVDVISNDQIVIVERFRDYLGEVLAKRKKIKFSGASKGSTG